MNLMNSAGSAIEKRDNHWKLSYVWKRAGRMGINPRCQETFNYEIAHPRNKLKAVDREAHP